MPREIRIPVVLKQNTEGNTPISFSLALNEKETSLWLDPHGEPVQQPVSFETGEGTFYVADGGEYVATITYTAADEKERSFTEDLPVEAPPTCPRCEERVPELVDYVCDDCRYGN